MIFVYYAGQFVLKKGTFLTVQPALIECQTGYCFQNLGDSCDEAVGNLVVETERRLGAVNEEVDLDFS
jgi:enamine deaminase RidA (YjgF/YER057c/UK114 family)